MTPLPMLNISMSEFISFVFSNLNTVLTSGAGSNFSKFFIFMFMVSSII
jgi:hypothetical protein